MATYEEKKKEALGFTLPDTDPFSNSIFSVISSPMRMKTGTFIENLERSLSEQIKRQIDYQFSLQRWDNEYQTDLKTAKKNLTELNKFLLSNDDAQLGKLLVKKPAADWLNCVFLEETELDELICNIKKTSLECRNILAAAIEKEVKRLVNFKTLFEEILEILCGM